MNSADLFEKHPPIEDSFYQQPTLDLAKALLGCCLFKETPEGTVAGMIVETEAYKGPKDRAAHSFGNRRTKRTEVMFGPPGYAYTYVMHTHCLFNVVSSEIDKPEAVLVRALEPVYGEDLIAMRRQAIKNPVQWTNGPGKLTKALGITINDYGRKLNQPPLWISNSINPKTFAIMEGPRIGIDNSQEAKDYPWRFWIKENSFLSR